MTTSLALIVLKLGTKDSPPFEMINGKAHFNIDPLVVVGIILYGISFLTYMYLISKYELGYIIPLLTAFVYIVIFFASYFIFHEVFTVMKIAGVSLIVLGLIFLNSNK